MVVGICDVGFCLRHADDLAVAHGKDVFAIANQISSEGAYMLGLDSVSVAEHRVILSHLEQGRSHLGEGVLSLCQLADGRHCLVGITLEMVCLGNKLRDELLHELQRVVSRDLCLHRGLRVSEISRLQGCDERVEVDALDAAMVIHQRQNIGRVFRLSVASCLHIEGAGHITGKPVSVVFADVTRRYLSIIDEVLIVGLAEEVHLVDVVPLATANRALVVVAVVGPAEEFATRVCPILDEGVPGVVVMRLATVADGGHVVPLGVVDVLVPRRK